MAAISNSSNSNGATIESGVLSLTPADGSNGGIVTTGSQIFSGNKDFRSPLRINWNGAGGTDTEGALQITGNNSTYKPWVSIVNYGNSAFSLGADQDAAIIGFDDNAQNLDFRSGIAWNSFPSTGTLRMRITSNGNVGIGTNSPNNKLDVVGNLGINTSGQTSVFSTYYGAGSDGYNIFIGGGGLSSGIGSGYSHYGSYNTSLGAFALNANTTGYTNIAIGQSTLGNNTTGYQNTAIGGWSLFSNDGGYHNTSMGQSAMYNNTTGYQNTAVGRLALWPNTSGYQNTAVGNDAGFYTNAGGNNLTSNKSVYLGHDTRASASGNINEIVIGASAQGNGSNSVTLGNTSVTNVKTSGTIIAGAVTYPNTHGTSGQVLSTTGSGTLTWTTTSGFVDLTTAQTVAGAKTFSSDLNVNGINFGRGGSNNIDNIAIGYSTLNSNTGWYNSAIGAYALQKNTTGYYNTATGRGALASNISGVGNTANGVSALIQNTVGSSNTAIGFDVLNNNTEGNLNTAIGRASLYDNTTGSYNTAIGYAALLYNTTGINNIAIGNWAQGSSPTVNNEITLGNSSVTTLRAQVTSITSLSDRRDKTNIIPIGEGLSFLKKLNPVSFTWNTRDKAKLGIKSAGFIAQELLSLQKQSKIGDNLDLVSENNPEKLEARYGNLLPVIVKAIQEESAEKDKEIKALKERLNTLEKLMNQLLNKKQ